MKRSVAILMSLVTATLVACEGDPDGHATDEHQKRAIEEWDPAAFTSAMVSCMNDAGFAAELSSPTSAEYDLGEQAERGRKALAECESSMIESGLLPRPEPKTEGELSEYYDKALVDAECLEGRGVDVPPAPSRESFIEHAGSNWNLFANVPQSQWRRIVELQEECLD